MVLTIQFYLHLSQLFGEEDADQEVSPDTADPELSCEYNKTLERSPTATLPGLHEPEE